jgi:uncharacterized protein YegL
VLLVDGVNPGSSETPTLARVLRDAGIEVTVIPAEGIPQSLLALQAYDLIILENVPADAVPESTQQVLDAHVRQMGAGLVMVGGPDSLGAGGWKGSVIEPLLPVRLDLPERLVQPDAAVAFVLDNSGSMGRSVIGSLLSQQEIANQSAALAVKSLSKGDLVAVIEFNNQTRVIVPLAPNTDPARTADKILSISAGGGTRLGPALEEARRQLSPAKATVKHVIVLSDGRSMESGTLPGIARAMNEEGINVSTISVGDQSDDETMSAIAREGGGRFYAVNNANLLPRFFLKAVRVVRTPLIREGSFDPVLLPTGSPLTVGVPTPPPLEGLVLSQHRPEPTITYAMEAPTGEPLLAHWKCGAWSGCRLRVRCPRRRLGGSVGRLARLCPALERRLHVLWLAGQRRTASSGPWMRWGSPCISGSKRRGMMEGRWILLKCRPRFDLPPASRFLSHSLNPARASTRPMCRRPSPAPTSPSRRRGRAHRASHR